MDENKKVVAHFVGQETPGFEFVFAMIALGIIFLLKRYKK